MARAADDELAAGKAAEKKLPSIVDGFIDAHVHVWTPDVKRYPLAADYTVADMQPPSFTPAELFAQAAPAGVARIVLIQMSFYGFDNRYMLDAIRQFPGRFAGVAVIDESADDVPATMKKLAAQGVRGFRIYPNKQPVADWIGSQGMQTMWKQGGEQGLAMCALINPDALPAIHQMCEKYPDTPVVIDHFARIGMDGQVRKADLDQLCGLAKFPKTNVKVSAYYAMGKKKAPYEDLGPMIQKLLEAYGPERLMWATDCPYQVQEGHTYAASIELIRDRLDFLSDSDRKWLLRGTAERLFFQ
jgi:predicted TIM-barrel fold metal-dependent hydrolase